VLWKEQNKEIPTLSPEGQTEQWKALKLSVQAANLLGTAQCIQESIWGGSGRWGRKASDQMRGVHRTEGSGRERRWQ
jgi:hypothetical protein